MLPVSPTKAKKSAPRRKKVKVKTPRFTIEELNEEFDIFLSTRNPYMSENCVEFDRKSQSFKPILDYRKPVLVLKHQGTIRKKKSEGVEILFGESEKEVEEKVKMKNKFNYRNVATQTPLAHESEHYNQAEPSLFPVLKFKGNTSKSGILAAYKYHEKKEKEADRYSWIPKVIKHASKYVGKKEIPFQDSSQKYLRLCERMIDQNLSKANIDYSYYDNPNDEFTPNSGSLFPLWRFSCKLTKGRTVTDVVWSGHFSDLFAVSYRSFKENEGDEDNLGLIREGGFICVYSLKGPNYPEKIFHSSAAVCCVSFHPGFSYLLAAGCEGGILNVYDLRRELNDPADTNKTTEKMLHYDTVNELRWLPDLLPQKFCTVSRDGKVLNWQFLLNDISFVDDVMSLKVKEYAGEVPPKGIEIQTESSLDHPITQAVELKIPGTSMSLNPYVKDLFVVGTETGVIYKCSFDRKGQLDSYEDHKRSVFRVHWNPYHPRVFLSCSDDMTARIWDHNMRESVFELFFENEVKDACWAPFSSTLFAIITGTAECCHLLTILGIDGYIMYSIYLCVFDLAVDKKKPICSYLVYTGKEDISLTTVCFHPTKPVLMVGDERGHVISFKLSPNLRSALKDLETVEKSKFIQTEVEKMEKLLEPSKGRIMRN